jgi:hypothetical protein
MTISDTQMRQYLLDLLPPDDAEKFDADLMTQTDEKIEELISFAEQDLIADYIRGRLSVSEREKFETYFLATPQRAALVRERMALSDALHAAAAKKDLAGQPKGILQTWLTKIGDAFRPLETVPAMGALGADQGAISGVVISVGEPEEDSAIFRSEKAPAIKVGDVFDIFRTASELPSDLTRIASIGSITVTAIEKHDRVSGKFKGSRPMKNDIVRLRVLPGKAER